MTGYHESELIGRNCRFLQGLDTDRHVVSQVKRAISEERDISVEILNYHRGLLVPRSCAAITQWQAGGDPTRYKGRIVSAQ
jgi:hypothetical protein